MVVSCGCVICYEGKLRLGPLANQKVRKVNTADSVSYSRRTGRRVASSGAPKKSILLEVSALVRGPGEGLHCEVGSLVHQGGPSLAELIVNITM